MFSMRTFSLSRSNVLPTVHILPKNKSCQKNRCWRFQKFIFEKCRLLVDTFPTLLPFVYCMYAIWSKYIAALFPVEIMGLWSGRLALETPRPWRFLGVCGAAWRTWKLEDNAQGAGKTVWDGPVASGRLSITTISASFCTVYLLKR